ncbi:MAG: hypothetical protein WC458_02070 [Patescibacteria group bacterium]
MKNILITGFRPFGKYKANPTEQFLKNHSVLGDLYLHSLIFPASTFANDAEDFGFEVVKTARSLKAVAIISLGMASDVKGLKIETRAINWSAGKYCLDFEQERKLNPLYPGWDTKEVNLEHWNIDFMFKNLTDLNIKFEKEISNKAGTFCGNALMYRILTALGYASDIPYIFLHIPCSAEAIAGLDDFAKDKDLITAETLQEILLVVSESIRIKK